VGVVVKLRQLARQVGVFIEHPRENSMASLNLTSTMLDDFGSWIYVANGLGGFSSHLVDPRKLEASTPTRSSDLNELLLLDLPM
jgi:hypothetical protein